MTCMTSVGFGNVAAETDNEKIFTICMMIIAGMDTIIILNLIINVNQLQKEYLDHPTS